MKFDKPAFRLATPKSPAIQREVNELDNGFDNAKKYFDRLNDVGEKVIEISNQARKAGNELLKQNGHDVNTHREILRRYSQSIAFAPQGTEELVLGYGNRSALLMHLQHYEEALVDINRAIQLSKSDDYKKKLIDRKERCIGLLNEQNLIKSTKYMTVTENKELEKIRSKVENFTPSTAVPCAADCVGVAYNDKLGRHLVATRDIKPGEIVIVERGYAGSPIFSEMYLVCSHCFQYAWNGIPCNKCFYAIYCSEDCKNEAFKEYHDIECPILKYLHDCVINTKNGVPIVTAVRLFITALRKEGIESIMKEISEEKNEDSCEVLLTGGILKSNFKACYNLSPWIKDVGTEFKELENNVLRILYLLLNHPGFLALIKRNSLYDETTLSSPQPMFHDDDSTVDPCMVLKFKEALMRLKSIASTNGYPIQTGTSQCGNCTDLDMHLKKCQLMRGSTIVPCCSLINHSCTHNVMYISVPKRKFVAFSTCPIKKGDMLCAGYKSVSILNGDVQHRATVLKYFICKCRACMENIDGWKIMMNERVNDFPKISMELKKNFSASVAKSYLQDPLNDLHITAKQFQEMIKISQLLYKHFNYYKAFVHALKCFAYLETAVARLYKDKLYMPDDC